MKAHTDTDTDTTSLLYGIFMAFCLFFQMNIKILQLGHSVYYLRTLIVYNVLVNKNELFFISTHRSE